MRLLLLTAHTLPRLAWAHLAKPWPTAACDADRIWMHSLSESTTSC